jgi:hypothetical protein
MPVFKDVPKVVIETGGGGGGGCLTAIIGAFFLLLLLSFCSDYGSDNWTRHWMSGKYAREHGETYPPPRQYPSARGTTYAGMVGNKQVFNWIGRKWYLDPPLPNRNAYLCVVNENLQWCW